MLDWYAVASVWVNCEKGSYLVVEAVALLRVFLFGVSNSNRFGWSSRWGYTFATGITLLATLLAMVEMVSERDQ